jgi:conjugative transfer signal peptidase TraF
MKRVPLVCATIPVLALVFASTVTLPKKLIYNASASAPIGFYWLDHQPVERGDYVLVRVPERVRKLVEERGYLPASVPFIKRVVGADGDIICRRGETVSINGNPISRAEKADGLGRPLPDWQGCHILTEQTVFLLQDHPQSFDGRYFGPVDRRLIVGRVTKLRFPWRKHEKS